MPKDKNGLSPLERRFIEEYLIDCNGRKAYTRAGFRAKNDKVAGVLASRLLTRDRVRAGLERRQAQIAELSGVTRERFHRELARIGLSDMTRFARVKGNRVRIQDTDNLTADESAAISELARTKDGMKIKLHGKVEALKLLGQALGYVKPDGSFTGNINVHIQSVRTSGLKEEIADILKDENVRRELASFLSKPTKPAGTPRS